MHYGYGSVYLGPRGLLLVTYGGTLMLGVVCVIWLLALAIIWVAIVTKK